MISIAICKPVIILIPFKYSRQNYGLKFQVYLFYFCYNKIPMKAFRLFNTRQQESTFEEGSIPELQHIAVHHFFAQTTIEPYQLTAHPAPRYQFVVTLKGKLKFTVSNGDSFILEPGIILIAKDTAGPGHTWELLEGKEWQRIYIVPEFNANDYFTAL
jgi:quercetin dioxygenase-like cupin family protein